MAAVRTPARWLRSQPVRPAVSSYPNAPLTRPRSTTLYLINEALARARMRRPQTSNSEAHRSEYRSARRVAMRCLREQDRWLNGR